MTMDIFCKQSPIELTFGFYDASHPFKQSVETRKYATLHNIFNALDWIPVIGIISGIARCIIVGVLSAKYKQFLSHDLPEDKKAKQWLATLGIRGAVSAIGLGFLFIIPDILFSMHSKTYPQTA